VPIRVVEYVREDGSIPFKKWFDDLDPAAAARVAAAQVRLSQGNTSSVKWFSGLGEYVIDWGPGYRVYLAQSYAAQGDADSAMDQVTLALLDTTLPREQRKFADELLTQIKKAK